MKDEHLLSNLNNTNFLQWTRFQRLIVYPLIYHLPYSSFFVGITKIKKLVTQIINV